MALWLYVEGGSRPGNGESHKSTSLSNKECSACQMKQTSWKATLDAEWMTLRTRLMPLQSHVGSLTNSSTPLPPPSSPPTTNATTCYPYLSARLVKGQLHLSLSATSDISQLIHCLPEIWSAWNNTDRIVLLWFFWKHLSLSLYLFLLSVLSPCPPNHVFF